MSKRKLKLKCHRLIKIHLNLGIVIKLLHPSSQKIKLINQSVVFFY